MVVSRLTATPIKIQILIPNNRADQFYASKISSFSYSMHNEFLIFAIVTLISISNNSTKFYILVTYPWRNRASHERCNRTISIEYLTGWNIMLILFNIVVNCPHKLFHLPQHEYKGRGRGSSESSAVRDSVSRSRELN